MDMRDTTEETQETPGNVLSSYANAINALQRNVAQLTTKNYQLQNLVDNASKTSDVIQQMSAANKKKVPTKELPQFSNDEDEDFEDWLLKFEMCAKQHQWSNDDALHNLYRCFNGTALRIYNTIPATTNTWQLMRKALREAFAKQIYDYDLAKDTKKSLTYAGNPNEYYSNVMRYLNSISDQPSQREIVNKLLMAFQLT
ncbi:uncharacterized protein LOC129601392 [Paramacrobiotus metropolitanus]|uniref:uncharacterized protein LOC129601392 n=1 Tax=Paramacrobiotus metropolitanus TaxID=2943436 RepID=UPI0024465C98|nr:uncharacterized protein LOC129601392 [Paramacrobiotus metropolitanus]